MTVKEIVRLSAVYLNKENVIKYLDGGMDNDALYAVNTLTICANVVISELATSYISMTTRERVTLKNGRIYLSDLNYIPIEVTGVYDGTGDKLSFSADEESIRAGDGATYIEYRYIPSNYGLTDKIGFDQADAPLRLLAYGVVAEYLLTERAFDESAIWRERYNDTLSILVPTKNTTLKQRAFI